MSSAYCNMQSFQSTNSSIRAHVSRTGIPSPWKTVVGRTFQGDDYSISTSSDLQSVNREKLIALFKRIQTSISKGKPGTRNDESSLVSDDDYLAETSVLEFLQQSSRETTGEAIVVSSDEYTDKSSNMKQTGESARKKRTPKKEKTIPVSQPPSGHKFSRPPSNFVKKSPIPSTSPTQSNDLELDNRELSSLEDDNVRPQVEEMKLSELKELAKERGIRGYSKLKKSELVELLRSQMIYSVNLSQLFESQTFLNSDH